MHRSLLAAPSVVLAIVLSACGSGGGAEESRTETTGGTSPSATPSAAATPAAQDSLCARLDPQALARVFGQKRVFSEVSVGASMTIPPMETCSVNIGADTVASPVVIGWSVVPDAQAINALRAYQQKTNGRYADLVDLKVPGVRGAFMVSRTGYGQVGDRAISLLHSGSTSTTPQQMTKALKLIGAKADDLPVWEPVSDVPACEGVASEVADVLGGEPSVVRGTVSSDGTPTCRWSTGSDGLTVSKGRFGGASRMLQEDKTLFGGKDVAGLGQKAVFIGGPDGNTLKVQVAKDEIVQFTVPPLMRGNQASLVALATKLLPQL